jgi:hypothetical protein
MENYQWFLLGLMAAWTPGLLAAGFILWRQHHTGENSTDDSSRYLQ